MKRFLPFIFPSAALLVVLFLTYRWYSHNTAGIGQISEFAEGIEIEELTDAQQSSVLQGVGDITTVTLKPGTSVTTQDGATSEDSQEADQNSASGQVRYDIADGKIRFSVMAQLPLLDSGFYQVWLKAVDSDAVRRAFTLEMSKAGYIGSAAISQETLPFEVIISKEMSEANEPSNNLLQAVVQAKEEMNGTK